MARRYDSGTTTFSPEGRLFQVEYAMEAIGKAGTCVGIMAKDGIVLAVEKKVVSKLLEPPKSSEKTYKLDDHLVCAVAGLTSDANELIDIARLMAQRYAFVYQQPQPIEQLVQQLCDRKHFFTQFGGLRPFGVSLLYAGWDAQHGFQLYHSDPSGNYGGWKAQAIGANNQAAKSLLKSDYADDMSIDDALKLSVKVLSKTMDTTTPSVDKMEFTVVTREDGKVVHKSLSTAETEKLLADVAAANADEGDM